MKLSKGWSGREGATYLFLCYTIAYWDPLTDIHNCHLWQCCSLLFLSFCLMIVWVCMCVLPSCLTIVIVIFMRLSQVAEEVFLVKMVYNLLLCINLCNFRKKNCVLNVLNQTFELKKETSYFLNVSKCYARITTALKSV